MPTTTYGAILQHADRDAEHILVVGANRADAARQALAKCYAPHCTRVFIVSPNRIAQAA